MPIVAKIAKKELGILVHAYLEAEKMQPFDKNYCNFCEGTSEKHEYCCPIAIAEKFKKKFLK